MGGGLFKRGSSSQEVSVEKIRGKRRIIAEVKRKEMYKIRNGSMKCRLNKRLLPIMFVHRYPNIWLSY